MPSTLVPTTASTSPSETPLIVSESQIHSTTPCSTVPVPSVTMNEFTPKTITNSPLMKPTAAPAASGGDDRGADRPAVLGVEHRDHHRREGQHARDREVVVTRGEHDDQAEREHDQHGL